jgi:tetratricopeptide (TPR) repeat protein
LLQYLPGVDKLLHFFQSAGVFLVVVWLLGQSVSWARRLAVAAVITVAAASFDELQQGWFGGRNVELADLSAGIAGLSVALGVAAWRRARPLSLVAIAVGLSAVTVVTHGSYLRTRDYNRGLLAEREGRLEDALDHYRAAVHSRPDHADAYNALAWTMLESGRGDPRDAVGYARRSLALRPGDPDTLDTYGWALYRAGRAQDAIEPLEQALAAKPDIYCIHYHLAMVYLGLGRHEEARRHLRQQIALMPRTKEAQLSAALLENLTASGSAQ